MNPITLKVLFDELKDKSSLETIGKILDENPGDLPAIVRQFIFNYGELNYFIKILESKLAGES